MMNFNIYAFNFLWQDLPWVIKLIIIFISIFLISAVCFFIAILWIRIYKIYRNKKKREQQLLLIDFLNSFIFDEDFDKELEIQNFKKDHLKSSLEIKVTIKEILHFHENLKGESATELEYLFKRLGLIDFTLRDLNKGSWFTTARAINALSELSIEVPIHKIDPYLNESRNEVRQQSQLYFLKLSVSNPLQFLDKTVRPLTTWQQIYIENALKNFYKGEAPDFSQWLYHDLLSVVEFSIRMVARYNQFEHIDKILPFLEHENDIIKCEAIKSLTLLEYQELSPLISPNFNSRPRILKLEILDAIKAQGIYEDLQKIGEQILPTDWEFRIKYLNIEQGFAPDKKDQIYSQFIMEKKLGI
jgi:hypothetical protein